MKKEKSLTSALLLFLLGLSTLVCVEQGWLANVSGVSLLKALALFASLSYVALLVCFLVMRFQVAPQRKPQRVLSA